MSCSSAATLPLRAAWRNGLAVGASMNNARVKHTLIFSSAQRPRLPGAAHASHDLALVSTLCTSPSLPIHHQRHCVAACASVMQPSADPGGTAAVHTRAHNQHNFSYADALQSQYPDDARTVHLIVPSVCLLAATRGSQSLAAVMKVCNFVSISLLNICAGHSSCRARSVALRLHLLDRLYTRTLCGAHPRTSLI